MEFVLDDDEGHVGPRLMPYQWKDLRGIIPPLPDQDSIDFRDAFADAMRERGDELMSGERSQFF